MNSGERGKSICKPIRLIASVLNRLLSSAFAPPVAKVCCSVRLRIRERLGPAAVTRYNGFNAAAVNGMSLPGVSSGDTIRVMNNLATQELPAGMDLQWTELSFLQIRAGNTALIVFANTPSCSFSSFSPLSTKA
jgi:hypothetical protein